MVTRTITYPDSRYTFQRWHHKVYRKYAAGGTIVDFDYVSGNGTTYDATDYVTKDVTTGRNWRKLIREGKNATTPLSGEKHSLHVSPGYAYVKALRNVPISGGYEYTEDTIWGDCGYRLSKPTNVSAIALGKADNDAKTRFIAKCRQVQTSFQGGTYLGEALDTFRMLRGDIDSLRRMTERYLRRVRRLTQGFKPRRGGYSPSTVGDLVDRIRDEYLKHTFGYAPLYNDIKNAAEAVARLHLDRRKPFKMVTATASDSTVTDSFINPGTPGSTLISFSGRVLSYQNAYVTYRGVVLAGMDSIDDVNKYIGIDPSNWLPTLWELVPGSFILDYAANVGDIINAVSFQRSRLLWVCKTTVQEIDKRLYSQRAALIQEGTTFTKKDWVFIPPSVHWNSKIFNRYIDSGTLVPDFTFRLGLPGWRRSLNMGSLIAQSESLGRSLRRLLFGRA